MVTRQAIALLLVLVALASALRHGPRSFAPLPEAPAAPVAPTSIDPNTATPAQLDALPGVGPTLAARIVAGRPYARVDDLLRVRGIGERTLARFRDRLRVGGSEVAQEAHARGDGDEVGREVAPHEGEGVRGLE